jgi:hypothetical protein
LSRPINLIFEFGDGTIHDASVSEVSGTLAICSNYGWFVNPISVGLDANPTYSIQVSHEDVPSSFVDYSTLTAGASIIQPFDDTHMVMVYWRILYDPKTNTTGTVSFPFQLKR